MAEEVLVCISLLLALAAASTIIARVIKQPAIIAYLVAGILAGPLFFNIIGGDASNLIQLLARIGVAFLLFIVGLSLDLRLLKEVGFVSVVAGIASMAVTGGLGYLIAMALGISSLASLYIAAVLAFSSTVVVVKILSDKKEIDTLHGRIALGILIVQDFVAAIALMAVPIITNHGSVLYMAGKFGIAIASIVIIFVFSGLVLTRFMSYLARSQETLFLFGIAWALVLATLFDLLGFSLEIGALIAGMSLASSKYTLELGGKIKPLRDFFVVLFFVFFGSQLSGMLNWNLFKIAIIFSVFILIGKPLITMATLRLFGYKKRTNFLASISLAQISEFSLILVLLGFSLGHLSQDIMNLTIIMALITIGLSSYGIYYSHQIFNRLSRLLNIFEGKGKEKDSPAKKESYDIVLFGYHRIGYKILETLKEMKASFVIVDYNPKVVLSLGKKGINCVYGDASDKEFLEELRLDKAKVVISTIPDEYSSLVIKERLKALHSNAVFIGTSEQPRSAMDLYNQGVDYVLVPHHLGGDYAAHMIRQFHTDKKKYREAGKRHMNELRRAKNNSLFGQV
jgi:Kef-type K+ transport system membrane component KefB/Trk K+ transport system NAD-binding subunit